MSSVALVSDSSHYLPRELVAENEIHEVSLYVTTRGELRRDADVTDYGAFYEEMRAEADLPTTSQPSVGDFLAVWKPLLSTGRDVVSIHISAALSGTFAAAQAARERLVEDGCPPGRVRLVDSRLACGALGWMLLAAAAAIRARRDPVAAAERAREAIEFRFALSTLVYLQRGGRIGPLQRWVGSTLRIVPILSLDEELEPVERVRTAARAHERIVAHLRARRDAGDDGFIVQHTDAPERAAAVVAAGREIFGVDPVFVSEIGPVLGAHVGPGLWGAAGVRTAALRG